MPEDFGSGLLHDLGEEAETQNLEGKLVDMIQSKKPLTVVGQVCVCKEDSVGRYHASGPVYILPCWLSRLVCTGVQGRYFITVLIIIILIACKGMTWIASPFVRLSPSRR